MSPALAPLLHVHVSASGIDERMSVPLDRTLELGRDADCDVALPSATVSRKHLSLFLRQGRLVVRDHSSNGTRVNGEPLHLALRELEGRAALEVGPYTIALQLDGQSDRALHLRDTAPEPSVEPVASPSLDAAPDPLALLLSDPSVREIMLLEPGAIFVERAGLLQRSPLRYRDADEACAALERIVAPQLLCFEDSGIIDVRCADGLRVRAIMPPLAARGPCITLQKPALQRTLEQLVECGAVSRELASFLARAVLLRANLVLAGAPGAGVTTFLQALSALLPDTERIATVEPQAELVLSQPDVLSLRAGTNGVAHDERIDLRALLQAALRTRPERIVLADCRGAEALVLLEALSHGYRGALTSVHADSPAAALQRLETLCLSADIGLGRATVRRYLARGVQLLVQLTHAEGTRRVTRVVALDQVDEHGELAMRDLFCFEQTSGWQRGAGAMGQGTEEAARFLERLAGSSAKESP
ncbi:MAG: Type secretion system hydrolase TadA/VirB11/CpaF, TadA subfamily [Myxococcaceae bacterium]|nr:Type secretion system hydrolase TadA/VirB11/CpaF, TadA subfamily [Myxococcaceae bacterium]